MRWWMSMDMPGLGLEALRLHLIVPGLCVLTPLWTLRVLLVMQSVSVSIPAQSV